MAKNLKNTNKDVKVMLAFNQLTSIVPIHRVNQLSDKCLRKDVIFHNLSEKVFDQPRLLNILTMKIKQWLKLSKSEFTYALAGYIYYCKDDFKKAEEYFLKAINKDPQNLDNWFDLAFSLYHQGENKYNLAKKILFNFDYCSMHFKNKRVSLKGLEAVLVNL